MTYRLWWTVGHVCGTEKEFRAAKHRLVPAVYEMLDDALRRANQVGAAGGVAWLIEGDDRTQMTRDAIQRTISKRGSELAFDPGKPMTMNDRRG
jgi:hypothetical protein